MAYRNPPGYHEHDGFYLRCLIGPGYLYTSATYQGSTLKISGVGASIGFAAGGVVAPNLAIYGELLGTAASNPTVDQDGDSGELDGTATVASFGPGIAYYLPGNSYLSGTLLFSQLSVSGDGFDEDLTDIGFGAALTGGKEWWVSTDWGIGVAGQLGFSSMKAKDVDTRFSAVTFAVLLSATYN
jgi:hypothetical protein